MITEDYVSFETAKLLKEKGFGEPCHALYHDGDDKIFFGLDVDSYHNSTLNVDCYACPTLQMTMKWLRKVHKIGVFPSTYAFIVGENNSAKHVYGTAIINLETHELMTSDMMPMPTYEQATETAIKYCLENLI